MYAKIAKSLQKLLKNKVISVSRRLSGNVLKYFKCPVLFINDPDCSLYYSRTWLHYFCDTEPELLNLVERLKQTKKTLVIMVKNITRPILFKLLCLYRPIILVTTENFNNVTRVNLFSLNQWNIAIKRNKYLPTHILICSLQKKVNNLKIWH